MNEHEIEPIRGLPELLPQGERILWQGTPDWRSLAIRALHVRGVVAYFAVLFVWSVWAAMSEGSSLASALFVAVRLVPVTLVAAGLLTLYAWLVHRTTIYTITNRRVVMRFGIALPMTLNIPFAIIANAGLKIHRDRTGDIPLTLAGADRISYLALWPHVRPWWTAKPQPMLRSVAAAQQVAQVLSEALRGTALSPAVSPAGGAALTISELARPRDREPAAA